MLTPTLAQEIAQETAAVTGLGILITDPTGTVIGSSDLKRVGTFHEASVAVIASREPAAHTAKQAAELRGVLPGLTLPILLEGEAVGTVGITGSPARVRGFGPVVRRHTEILLQESASLRFRLLRERSLEDLLREIATFDSAVVEPALLTARARDLGYDLRVRRAAVVFVIRPSSVSVQQQREDLTVLRAELVRTIRERFSDPADIVASAGSGRFIALRRAYASAGSDGSDQLAVDCRRILEAIEQRHGLLARAGIGSCADDLPGLQSAIADASDALDLGGRISPQRDVHDIGGLRTQQVVAGLGPRARQRLGDAELSQLRDQPDWPQMRETVIAWCTSGFNLVAAAAALHVHRNTLIYRLAKIERISGRSSRDFPNCIATYLACLSDELAPVEA